MSSFQSDPSATLKGDSFRRGLVGGAPLMRGDFFALTKLGGLLVLPLPASRQAVTDVLAELDAARSDAPVTPVEDRFKRHLVPACQVFVC